MQRAGASSRRGAIERFWCAQRSIALIDTVTLLTLYDI